MVRALTPALAAAVLSLAVAPGTAAAQLVPPTPDRDSFYAVPGNIADYANGAVLGSRPVRAMAPLPVDARAWQVKYKTLGTHGEPTATVATVLVPNAPWRGRGRRPLVSLQVPEDGVGTRCSPSYTLRAGALAGVGGLAGLTPAQTDLFPKIPPLLAQGWAVVTSDFEGPRSEFASAAMAAHGVLDGIRAARRFKPAGIGLSAPLALWGYSGGGFATNVAAQFQRRYAPELEFEGIAMGGVPGDIREVYGAANATVYGGAITVLFIGLDRAFPEAHLSRHLNASGRRVMAGAQHDCLFDAVARNPAMDFARQTSATGVREFLAVQRRNSPLWLPGVPRYPVYQYHARDDDLVPFPPARALMERYCAADVTLQFESTRAGGHAVKDALASSSAVSYLADRFAGKPAPSSCPPLTSRRGAGVSLTGLRLSRRRFRAARRGRAVAPRGRRLGRRVGTRVRYRLSRDARVTFRVQRARRRKGRLVGGRCVKRTPRNAGRRRCARYRTLRGRVVDRGEAGVNRLRLTGRWRGRRLPRGRYRLIARAFRGHLRSQQGRARFRIVRR